MSSVILAVLLIGAATSARMPTVSDIMPSHSNISLGDVHRTFWLYGDAFSGWNNSIPGPTITVSSGDLVTIMLSSADSPDYHNWYVDANESSTTSKTFTCSTYCVNFTFTPIIRGNLPTTPVYNETIFPHGGDWTYHCVYHSTMYGMFRVLPEASFVYTPSSPLVGQTVSFDASASKPSIGATIASYSWDFGDGNKTTVSSPTITHPFATVARFAVSLTVTDSLSNNDTSTQTVTVTAPGIELGASPTVVTVLVNSQAISTVTVASNGTFTGTVTLSETSSPTAGLSCNFTPNSIVLGSKGNSTLSCSSPDATNYSVAVIAKSGSVGNVTSVTFSFQDFQIAASSPAPANSGASSTSTITLTGLNGFAEVIYLTETVPSGVTCGAIIPSSVTGSGSATVSCSASVAANYTVLITGTAGITHVSSFVLVVVQSPSGGGLSIASLLEIGGVVFAGVVIAAVLLFRRRRQRR